MLFNHIYIYIYILYILLICFLYINNIVPKHPKIIGGIKELIIDIHIIIFKIKFVIMN